MKLQAVRFELDGTLLDRDGTVGKAAADPYHRLIAWLDGDPACRTWVKS